MSPRPRKWRQCRWLENEIVFKPVGMPAHDLPIVHLAADEVEALRLCDVEGLSQEEAGEKMGVSRGTIQRIVKDARQKLVRALTDGVMIALAGGSPGKEAEMPNQDGTGPAGRGAGKGRGLGPCGGGKGQGRGQGRGQGGGQGQGGGPGRGQGQGGRQGRRGPNNTEK
jgi:uncharacterized protein